MKRFLLFTLLFVFLVAIGSVTAQRPIERTIIRYEMTDGSRLMVVNHAYWVANLQGRDPFMGVTNWGIWYPADTRSPSTHADGSMIIDPANVRHMYVGDVEVNVPDEAFRADDPFRAVTD